MTLRCLLNPWRFNIRRNPDCDGHVLMGGIDLSDQAKSDFKEIQDTQAEVGKTVVYIPNSGIENLEQHYTALPKSSSGDEDQT